MVALIMVGNDNRRLYSTMFVDCTTSATTSATVDITYCPSTSYDSPDICCDYPEQIEVKKIIRYAVVWSLIAYAVALRKSIEQRSRAPPNVLLGRRRHSADNLPKLVPVALQ